MHNKQNPYNTITVS